MVLHDYLIFFAYPLSGILGVLLARMWNRRQIKLTETASYAAEVFDGWREQTQSYREQLQEVRQEVHDLRTEIAQLRIQLITTGCGRDACNIRIPTMVAGIPQPRKGLE